MASGPAPEQKEEEGARGLLLADPDGGVLPLRNVKLREQQKKTKEKRLADRIFSPFFLAQPRPPPIRSPAVLRCVDLKYTETKIQWRPSRLPSFATGFFSIAFFDCRLVCVCVFLRRRCAINRTTCRWRNNGRSEPDRTRCNLSFTHS